MAPRKCSGCGVEMGPLDSYCRVCGRIQMPTRRSPPEGERIGTGAMLLWMILALAVISVLAWLLVKLEGI